MPQSLKSIQEGIELIPFSFSGICRFDYTVAIGLLLRIERCLHQVQLHQNTHLKDILNPFLSYYPVNIYFLHIFYIMSGISYFLLKTYQKRTSDINRGNMDIIIKKEHLHFPRHNIQSKENGSHAACVGCRKQPQSVDAEPKRKCRVY